MVDFKLALVTLFLPFLIYLHLFFDESRDYIKIFGYEYQHMFHDNETFSWYVISNLISLLILLLIFNCNRGRWRFFLIPIIIDFFTTIMFAFSEYQGYIDFFFSPLNIIGNIIFIIFILRLNYQIKGKIENQHILIPSDLIINEMLSSWNYKYNRHLNRLIKDKSKFSVKDYLSRIYFLIELINEKYRENDFGFSFKASFEKRKNYEIILSLITLIICLLVYLDNFIPSEWESIKFGNLVIESHGFQNVKALYWHITRKFSLCSLSILWFISSVRWWRWAILSPILFYSYQFWESFQPISEVDSAGNLRVFPLVLLTTFGVLILSRVIRRISKNLDYQVFLREEFDKSIGELSRLEGNL